MTDTSRAAKAIEFCEQERGRALVESNHPIVRRAGQSGTWLELARMFATLSDLITEREALREALTNMVEHICDSECSEHGCAAVTLARKALEPHP